MCGGFSKDGRLGELLGDETFHALAWVVASNEVSLHGPRPLVWVCLADSLRAIIPSQVHLIPRLASPRPLRLGNLGPHLDGPRKNKDTVRVSLQEYLFTGSSKATVFVDFGRKEYSYRTSYRGV